MPAYNAGKTLERTYRDIPFDVVDDVVLVDDHSNDNTVETAHALGIRHIIEHQENKGYGGNQKTCYRYALKLGADIIVMLHPDYQYNPKLIPAMTHLIASETYPVVIASRILGKGALKGGMPLYKYISNRFLTLIQNLLMGQKLSEYHTGYRAFHRSALASIDFEQNSNDFVFDNEILAQLLFAGNEVAEVTCPANYFPEASSINFSRSTKYGLGVLRVSLLYRFHRWGIKTALFCRVHKGA